MNCAKLQGALAIMMVFSLPGCARQMNAAEATGTIILSDGMRLWIARPSEGVMKRLVPDAVQLPPHNIQAWPSLRQPERRVIFEAQATNGPNALVEIDLNGNLIAVHAEAHLPSVSPDGKRVAYFHKGDLVVRPIEADVEPRLLASGMDNWMPAVWISGVRLVFQDQSRRNRVVDATSTEVKDWKGPRGSPSAVSADGRYLLLAGDRGIVEQPLAGEGGEETLRTSLTRSFGASVIPSPDGRWLIYSAGRSFSLSETTDLHLLDRSTGADTVLRERMTIMGGIWIED